MAVGELLEDTRKHGRMHETLGAVPVRQYVCQPAACLHIDIDVDIDIDIDIEIDIDIDKLH